MDADESIILNFAFNSNEQQDLENVIAELSCVKIDADSPRDCLPSGDGCLESECGGPCDPRRENNPARDMSPRGIARAIGKLLASGIPLEDSFHILNHWR